jgi:hypothetical protein
MPVESLPAESSRTGQLKSAGRIVWINVVLGAGQSPGRRRIPAPSERAASGDDALRKLSSATFIH